MVADIDDLYKELTAYVKELETKFLDKHIPAEPGAEPSSYAHDVKAYCVLAHAAFEEFVEGTVLAVAEHAVDQWKVARKPSETVIALLCWKGSKIKIDENENSQETKPFDYLRPLIEEAKADFSRHVHRNHGVSISYLRSMLIPVAIEIKQDANLLNSLKKLAEGRGDYAHKGRGSAVLAPEDAKQYVQDVLGLCDDVRAKALLHLG